MIEEAFGWIKTEGGLLEMRHEGLEKLSGQALFAFAAYNLTRIHQPARKPRTIQTALTTATSLTFSPSHLCDVPTSFAWLAIATMSRIRPFRTGRTLC